MLLRDESDQNQLQLKEFLKNSANETEANQTEEEREKPVTDSKATVRECL